MIPYRNPDPAEEAEQRLRRHSDQLKMFTDPDGYISAMPGPDRARVDSWLSWSPDPDRDKKSMATRGYVGEFYGLGDDQLANGGYEVFRDRFMREEMGAPYAPDLDDATFHGLLKAKIQKEEEELVQAKSFVDAGEFAALSLKPGDMVADLEKIQSTAKNIDPANRDRYVSAYRMARADTEQKVAPYRQTARKILSALEQETGKTEGKGGIDDALDLMLTVPEPVQQAMFRMLSSGPSAADDKGAAQKTGEAAARGLMGQLRGYSNTGVRSLLGIYEEGIKSGTPQVIVGEDGKPDFALTISAGAGAVSAEARAFENARPATPEEAEQLRGEVQQTKRRMDLASRLMSFAESSVDPVTSKNFLARAWYGAANSAGAMAPLAFGPAGLGIAAGGYADMAYTDLRAKGVDIDTAMVMAQTTGVVQAGLDRLQFGILKGVPGLKNLTVPRIAAASPLAGNKLAQAGAAVALIQAPEYAIEKIQDAAPVVTAYVAEKLGMSVPEAAGWRKEWESWEAWDPDTYMALLPLSLVGGGYQGINSALEARKEIEGMLTDKTKIAAMGIDPTEAERIAALPEGQRRPAYEKAYAAREVNAPAAVAARQEVAATVAAEKSVGRVDVVAMAEAGISIGRVTDDTGAPAWKVTAADGAATVHTDFPEAMATARAAMDEGGIRKDDSFFDALDTFAETMNPDDLIKVTKESPNLLSEAEGAQTRLEEAESDVERGKASADLSAIWERANVERRKAGQPELNPDMSSEADRAGLENFRVFGKSETEFRDGIARSVMTIYEGGNAADLLEESAEAAAKTFVNEGGLPALAGALRSIEAATGDQYLLGEDTNPTAVAEGFSDLARVWATMTRGSKVSKAVRGEKAAEVRQMRDRLRREQAAGNAATAGIFEKLTAYFEAFKATMARAARLLKAKKGGKISAEVEDLINKSVGLSAIRQHEAAVRKDVQKSEGATFAVRPADSLEAISSALNSLARDPAERLAGYEAAAESLAGMSRAMAFNDEAVKSSSRKDQLRYLQTLDAILVKFPPEVRAKVGGFIKLASLTTNAARQREILDRVKKLDRVVETFLRKDYAERITDLFAKATPKSEGGQKDVGKLGAVGHAWFDAARAASRLTAAQASARIAEIEASEPRDLTKAEILNLQRQWGPEAVKDEDTARDMLAEEVTILETFGGMEEMDAAALANAFKEADDAYTTNRHEWIARLAEKKERREAQRGLGTAEVGGSYDAATHNRMNARKNVFHSMARAIEGFADMHFAPEAHAGNVFGFASKTRDWVQRQIHRATSAETDGINARNAGLAAMFEKVFPGGQIRRMKKVHELQVRKETGLSGPAAFLSEMQGVHLTMLARDAESAAWLAEHGWDTGTLAEVEGWLSPQAKEIRDWLAAEYDAQYDRINAVYSRTKGVNLPRVKFYAPRLVEHGGKQADMTLDGQNIAGMNAGFTRRRFVKPTGPPKLADALTAYVANARVVEHYLAWAEPMTEFKATVLSRDVRLAAETHKGAQKYGKLARGIRAIEEDGIKQAILQNEVGQLLTRWMDANSKTALLGRMTLIFKQLPALMASAAKVGAVDFLRSSARIGSGQGAVSLKEMWNSGIIQRRMGNDAEWSRMLAKGERANAGVIAYAEGKNWDAIGFADAGFTLWSATVAYDSAYREAIKLGMSEADAKADAWERAGIMVDQTAQPQTTSAKSLMELELGFWARIFFAFQGPTRPLWAAMYEAAKSGDILKAGDTYLAVGVMIPLFAQAVSGLLKAAFTDDDLEDVFKLDGYVAALGAATTQGVFTFGPVGEFLAAQKGVAPRVAAIPIQDSVRLLLASYEKAEKGQELTEAQTTNLIKSASNLLGGRAAAAGIAVNIWRELTGLWENLAESSPNEKVEKK